MALQLLPREVYEEARYPIKSPNPADTVDTIVSELAAVENEIDSDQVNSEVVELSTGGMFLDKNVLKCLHIRLRNPKAKFLQKFGAVIVPVVFGNLVYVVKYEYVGGWLFDKGTRISMAKSKLNTIDKWMEYTFISTLADYVFVKILKHYDAEFDSNLKAYSVFLSEA